ncbi:MAG: LytR/AlgR family response regulator transcription factor [Bradymonadaceae bacterium]
MRVFIVDDEQPAREELRWLIEQCDGVEVAGEASSADDARSELSTLEAPPDVLFLDIDMPGVDGIRFAECLGNLEPEPLTIFVTAYEEYAVDAFDVDAIDYLLKPVRLERLEESVDRVRARLVDREANPETDDGDRETSPSPLTRISVKTDAGFRVIDTEEILFFESENGEVSVETTAGRFPTDFSLKFLESRLPSEAFYRCHRSFIVRLDAIENIVPAGAGTYRLYLSGGDGDSDRSERPSAPLARSRAGDLKARIPWSA